MIVMAVADELLLSSYHRAASPGHVAGAAKEQAACGERVGHIVGAADQTAVTLGMRQDVAMPPTLLRSTYDRRS